MHKWKSFLVCVFLILIILIAVSLIFYVFTLRRLKKPIFAKCTGAAVYCIFALLITMGLWKYTNPHDQTIIPTLYCTIELKSGELIPSSDFPWHTIYEQYGLYSSSFFINPSDQVDHHFDFEWPEMDFQHHTYLVSYGKQLTALRYNVWETIDYPVRTGAFIGYADFEDSFYPNRVFIYELPKIRIDHDINND